MNAYRQSGLCCFFIWVWLVIALLCMVACSSADNPSDSNSSTSSSIDSSTDTDTSTDSDVANVEDHEDRETDYTWDSSGVIYIVLNGDSITAESDSAVVNGSKVTITAAGTYSISGVLNDGQIIVNTEDEETVRLILNEVDISSSTTSPLLVENSPKTIIVLADDTKNVIRDAAIYVFEDSEADEPNAAIFSKENLTIYGNGNLTVTGNYNDGIASKDGLIIAGGTIAVTAPDDGIRGKDYLIVENGTITVNAGGDGLKADNEEDAGTGYITIEKGTLNITSGGDAITAATDVMVADGEITLVSGGGSSKSVSSDTSAKGIKGLVDVTIDGGSIAISSADDAIHSNNDITVNGGSFEISSGDDGIHADTSIVINSGDFDISKSYEGIESAVITINDGSIQLVSSDDGINVAGGNDSSSLGGRPGENNFTYSSNQYLYVNGSTVFITATGDGIDVNGSIAMTGGTVIVNGPTVDSNGALDYDGSCKISGGFLLAAGSLGMAQAPDSTSSQYSVAMSLRSTKSAGTLVHLESSDGEEIFTFKPNKSYRSIVFSSPALSSGSQYTVSLGGSSTGTLVNGLYQDGDYTPGTEYSFTVSSITTKVTL